MNPRLPCLACALLVLTGCAPLPVLKQNQSHARFEFALIGDTPYNDFDATHSVPNMIAEINRHRLAFVVHDGDIKSGSTPCTDEIFLQRRDLFNTILHPFILIYGDNEWNDCGKADKVEGAGDVYDPMERLQRLRGIFSSGHHSLGRRTMALDRQSDEGAFPEFVEHVRWSYGGVVFAGLNIVGTGNNHGQEEFDRRNRATIAWLKSAFHEARRTGARALMVVVQANPLFDKKPSDNARRGFNDFLDALEAETIAFHRPVVLVHGDTHYFRIDKPMINRRTKRRVEHFTRLETFGNPDVHWVRVAVDWRRPEVFTFHPEMVEANVIGDR